jgi:hypothetical protein
MTSYADPPHYGVAVRTQQAADATGPQASNRFVTALPEDFNVVVGWEYFLDNDHLEASGPVEAIYHRDGKLLYAGMPLRVGDLSLTLDNPPSAGLIARVSDKNSDAKGFVQRFSENHYFLEGDPARFTVSLAAGPKTPLPTEFQWRLLDAYRRPVEGGEGRKRFAAATSDRATTLRSIGRELISAELPIGLLPPGVYWIDLDADEAGAFERSSDARGSAPHERIEHDTSGRGHEPHEPTHECHGLDRWVVVAPAFGCATRARPG